MLKEIKTHREQIADLCRRYGVKRLGLFGSAARGTDFEGGAPEVLAQVLTPRTIEGALEAAAPADDGAPMVGRR